MRFIVFKLTQFRAVLAVTASAFCLMACGGNSSGADNSASPGPTAQVLSAQAVLGEKIFKDVSLSASGRQACISCHVADTGHAGPNALSAQLGGPGLDQQGVRAAPGINYLAFNKSFHFEADGTPTGGFFWDGRATSLQGQASEPFFNPKEMANASVDELALKLSRAPYAAELQAMFGADIFKRPADALARITLLLQAYQLEDDDFKPFSSKYDEFLRGKASLSDQELRGLAWFNAAGKGNCASCHPSAKAADGSFPLFTDFTYDNLGVPRNQALKHNADPAYFDLGLCARGLGDLTTRTDLCGAFKVPSLRNVALRKVLFHNGRFSSLKEALSFYVTRDTDPARWYSQSGNKADGTVNKFDDLPAAYKGNVNVTEVPYNRKPGDAPALSDAEIDDVVAFLGTLSDGYKK